MLRDAVRRGEEVESFARSSMLSLCVYLLCSAREIESRSFCTADTSLIHRIRFNQKPDI